MITGADKHQDLILTALPVVFYAAAPDERLDRPWVSQNSVRITGFAPEAFASDHGLWVSRLHPDDRERVLAEFLKLPPDGACTVEYRWLMADQTYRWFLDTAVFTRESGAGDRRLAGLWMDVTKRKAAEAELEASRVELERSREELRALAGKLLTVQDEERRRISRDLHDDVSQRLAVIGLELEAVYGSLRSSSSPFKRQLRAIHKQVVRLSDDLRHLAYQFHQTIVEDLGLVVALQRYVNDFVRRTGIKARFIKRHVPEFLAQDVATCLYRVAQESLGNVAAHAKASHVTLELIGSDDEIRLRVRDSGVGMDVEAVRQRSRGLGLLSMTERVRLLNGSVELRSRPGQGTEMSVRLPLTMDQP